MPGLYRLNSLPHGLASKLAEFLANRLRRLLPGFLFAARHPDCQCVTHALCVTHLPSSVKSRNIALNGFQSTAPTTWIPPFYIALSSFCPDTDATHGVTRILERFSFTQHGGVSLSATLDVLSRRYAAWPPHSGPAIFRAAIRENWKPFLPHGARHRGTERPIASRQGSTTRMRTTRVKTTTPWGWMDGCECSTGNGGKELLAPGGKSRLDRVPAISCQFLAGSLL